MNEAKTPDLSVELANRIRLVRRDMGGLLFHFTRKPPGNLLCYTTPAGAHVGGPASASAVLAKILTEARLVGTGAWTGGEPCICFTEAPIHEFNAVFSLIELAAQKEERPRYEPYGIAVPKSWLFERGGRPVIYDDPEAVETYPAPHRYRVVPYNPAKGIDFTWEREWRIKGSELLLDPRRTLAIVPTADEAFGLVYDFSDVEADWDVEGSSGEGYISGSYHVPRWLAVSLDLFGLGPVT